MLQMINRVITDWAGEWHGTIPATVYKIVQSSSVCLCPEWVILSPLVERKSIIIYTPASRLNLSAGKKEKGKKKKNREKYTIIGRGSYISEMIMAT